MKKVLITLAIIAVAGAFASCSKTCQCTTFVAGNVTSEYEVDLDDIDNEDVKKCKDLNTVVEVAGLKAGNECK